jgi:hypothetical protein
MAGVGSAPRRSMAAKNIRDLQAWTRHASRALGGRLSLLEFAGDMLQRAHDLADGLGGDARVEHRGIELGVTKQHLDHSDIDVPRAAGLADQGLARSEMQGPSVPCGGVLWPDIRQVANSAAVACSRGNR